MLQKKMKIAVKAEVEADLVIAGPVIAKLYPYDFEIYKENDNLWLKVSKPVKEYEKYLPKVFCKDGALNITIGCRRYIQRSNRVVAVYRSNGGIQYTN